MKTNWMDWLQLSFHLKQGLFLFGKSIAFWLFLGSISFGLLKSFQNGNRFLVVLGVPATFAFSFLCWVQKSPTSGFWAFLLFPICFFFFLLLLSVPLSRWNEKIQPFFLGLLKFFVFVEGVVLFSRWAQPFFGMLPSQKVHIQLLLGLVLGVLFLYFDVWKRLWFETLALSGFFAILFLFGLHGWFPTLAMDPLQSPMLWTSCFTFFVVLQSAFSTKTLSEDAMEWWLKKQGLFRTHVFLVGFTICTLYPVLLVFKMALTPSQGFSMSLNPVPNSLASWWKTLVDGNSTVRKCHQQAMFQNFHEVMGTGDTCRDLLCESFRKTKDPYFLNSAKLCQGWRSLLLLDSKKSVVALEQWKEKIRKVPLSGKSHQAREHFLEEIRPSWKERSNRKSLFGKQLINSLLIALVTTLLGIFLACTAAYAFSRFQFPGKEAGLMSFLVSQMFPGTLMMIPLYLLISKLGLLNSLMGLTLVYSTTSIPFCVWMLKGYFDTIPKEIEEAAVIDGASRTMIFWRIILPLSKPAIAVTALFSFMTAWNEFILAATFMNKESSYTLPVMLQRYVGAHSTEWGHFAAGAILVSFPIVLLFYALQKFLVSGLTAGSVKG